MSSFRKKTKKDGTTTYTWRGRVPIRGEDGKVSYEPVERGTGARTLAEARIRGKQIEREYHERANLSLPVETDPVEEPTFAVAALSYMRAGRERTYLAPILERIGDLPLSGITQEVVQELTLDLKGHCKPSYQNRSIFTPILAVMNYAAKLKMCPPPLLIRPKGHDTAPPLAIPDKAWFEAIWPHLSPSKRAAVLLITLHGLRISEALKRTPGDLDMDRGLLSIPTSKTGEPFLLPLGEPVLEAIREIDGWRSQRWLFGTCHNSNFHKALARACKTAGVDVFGSHAIGRHSFATRILRDEGKSLAFLKEAGRWKKIAMPADRYGHLERSEVDAQVKDIASKWRVGIGDAKVVRISDRRGTGTT